MKNEMNLTMLTDFYEFTMMNGFFAEGYKDKIAYFDMFFRRVPEDGGFAIMAGVEQIIEYIKEINFTAEDIEYLRSKGIFKEEFLKYLENFKFECDVWAVPDGTPIFPGEPIITVRGADDDNPRSGHPGPAAGDLSAAHDKPPEPYCD